MAKFVSNSLQGIAAEAAGVSKTRKANFQKPIPATAASSRPSRARKPPERYSPDPEDMPNRRKTRSGTKTARDDNKAGGAPPIDSPKHKTKRAIKQAVEDALGAAYVSPTTEDNAPAASKTRSKKDATKGKKKAISKKNTTAETKRKTTARKEKAGAKKTEITLKVNSHVGFGGAATAASKKTAADEKEENKKKTQQGQKDETVKGPAKKTTASKKPASKKAEGKTAAAAAPKKSANKKSAASKKETKAKATTTTTKKVTKPKATAAKTGKKAPAKNAALAKTNDAGQSKAPKEHVTESSVKSQS
ncbi:uncharacterized protein A1O5_09741 [Cladophialophora psammophila CBS 110553]|uniref:Uncharacterized protein n=1 Tax=Cladophialophora psammophila CBS 110553 TaxID=1182543 RepID=W9X9H1_9EURO|nr:uncharacterized protein A1O5_09741 [Cladophialophora psammophila CBS 110553]EXJ67094.1 hypothetical protein A1O5_09741 [Cladophialophora psammophila CBS 110553]